MTKIVVHDLYSDLRRHFEGDDAVVAAEVVRVYPFLRSHDVQANGDLPELVRRLNREQFLSAGISGMGSQPPPPAPTVPSVAPRGTGMSASMAAARFLAGRGPAAAGDARSAFWEADGSPIEAALVAHGLEPSEANRRALSAFQRVAPKTGAPVDPVPRVRDVEPANPDGQRVAEEVQRAFQDSFVTPIELGGVHSKGSLLARDPQTQETVLLKPGSGGQSPAAGAREDSASQSRREAAFWHVADAWGLGDAAPECQLLLLDGKEYAAIRLLPWRYKVLADVKRQDPAKVGQLLARYVSDGIAHRWAVLDYVLGNSDRHAGNMMEHDGDVKLIDHGSAMAGPDFAPGRDKYTFTPFYLRSAFEGKFSRLTPEERVKVMPRLPREVEESFRRWLEALDQSVLERILPAYGVQVGPAASRLAQLKARAAQEPADLAVNRAWAGG